LSLAGIGFSGEIEAIKAGRVDLAGICASALQSSSLWQPARGCALPSTLRRDRRGAALAARGALIDDRAALLERGAGPMQLHYSVASPFVRKVMAVAIETGLDDRLEPTTRMMTPIKPDPDLVRDNPLGKIPCLVADDGAVLYDSRVICEYLDSLHDRPKMFPAAGPARWTALRRQAEGDGIMDAGVLARYETFVRPQEHRWSEWIEGQKQKFHRALDALEAEAETFGDTVDIGTIAIGCALGYLDFRYADEGWRATRSRLEAWFEGFAARPSMARTVPVEIW
jgi:glutathione S-transferase